MPIPSTERFGDRVESYRRHRPRYPRAVLDLLARECGLVRETEIADIAAGTGLLTEIFLAHGNSVVAMEPNASMRRACAALTAQYPQLRCIDGTAESTGIPAHSVDMVTVGQAMHWFDLGRAHTEFLRILRPGGWCVVVDNQRRMHGGPFPDGYERILQKFGLDYEQVRNRYLRSEQLAQFFGQASLHRATLPNVQMFDLAGLTGRILSSSYMPQEGHPRYAAMVAEIEALFLRCAEGGHVRMEYECVVVYGQLGAVGAHAGRDT